ncbi:XTP/dITP diphosphohydrolase [Dysgonomonas sp. PFB1-18]|uniref:non-canonical purine NTP diphosphatase n=1 Tax=unclassified Dysgonomonas TaxID=2630389 RepID=UPI0024739769|nr:MULTISPECIES: non-canonical purine NTP diphosphatase [unclassified Dysgonomonas]MDH6309103.1 XTP/dITP diphosphohydrolase [Dysgonomonas sp. PF1-14]MDH6339017.1 XTP/dITP diphosphohydrolase [Dysgonomonas sp. PF1-16]MDH6380352.1 XTP/dITP diphosphohydrolase [Dysgonomonas sp. PFB1-18]MDH6397845.1 XTP/dITP diphosphohydrolase [Dysgonomonas sp. PF1-23]
MKQKLVFATNNAHKLEEVREVVGDKFNILSLQDIGCHEDIAETGETLEENALIKVRYVKEKYGYDCFGDDTGLEVEALNGAPGVYSARYAGDGHDAKANMKKLLHELNGVENRRACFRSVIALISDGKEYLFEGRIDGDILTEEHGTAGFGYDPVFRPIGYKYTFAELGMDVKNEISHRALAVKKLCEFLDKI